jgi:hypothetical protein
VAVFFGDNNFLFGFFLLQEYLFVEQL